MCLHVTGKVDERVQQLFFFACIFKNGHTLDVNKNDGNPK